MESKKRVCIRLPEEYKEFSKSEEWDHGIVVTDLNPHVTKGDLHTYFQKFGTITESDIRIDKSSGWPKGVGFVRYSSSEEAEAAKADEPPKLGGFPIRINKIITPKNRFDSQLKTPQHRSFQPDLCVN
ncbi:heterogeneous nuclear ribonucleoprotein D0 [Rhinichthys klamathensis goyatoka]|uniref:heterogeneous nuclear ribonucleoprotein D0 n=1 Tax=Rhinichthys klamathensis goyatoka TaxID=3034132 RepID=UPI0024B58E4F|nr:heterogeneous nuclear ribonucleoprotein D0 [Rhinichthys klamathensis goyatoka]